MSERTRNSDSSGQIRIHHKRESCTTNQPRKHNEQDMIANCIRSILNMSYPATHMRIVVIADNCTDDTDKQAWNAGAECLVRKNLTLLGKPAALAWAVEQQCAREWDACVIIDADTEVDTKFAHALSAHAPLRNIAVQGYFATLNEDASSLTRLAGVLARCHYEVLYPLRASAGLNSPLTGNGMCIGRDLLVPCGW